MYEYKLVIQSSYNGRNWHDNQENPSNISFEFISQQQIIQTTTMEMTDTEATVLLIIIILALIIGFFS